MILDGDSYVIEINHDGRYRTCQYGNPQRQKWPEAKKIISLQGAAASSRRSAFQLVSRWFYNIIDFGGRALPALVACWLATKPTDV